jgi:hypothetical protein
MWIPVIRFGIHENKTPQDASLDKEAFHTHS